MKLGHVQVLSGSSCKTYLSSNVAAESELKDIMGTLYATLESYFETFDREDALEIMESHAMMVSCDDRLCRRLCFHKYSMTTCWPLFRSTSC